MANPSDIYQDPNFSGQPVYGPPAPTGQAQPRSLLDILRERTTRELEGERLARLQEFGAGMLASGSPNFFTNLAAGARAQAEGERSRTDRLRQVAEAERQAAAQQAEEQYRRDMIENERLRRANDERRINAEIARGDRPQYTVVGQDAAGNAIVMDPRTSQRQTLEGVTPLQVAAQSIRSDSATLTRATTAANQAVRDENRRRADLAQNPLTPQEAERVFQEAFERVRRGTQPGASPAPGTTGGGPAPSQTLQYGGPAAPAAPRTGPRISAQPPQQPPQ